MINSIPSVRNQENKLDRIETIVLDLNVLCDSSEPSLDENQRLFYSRNGLIIQANKTYFVFKGALEFLKALYSDPRIRVAFFSRRPKEFNIQLVSNLLRMVVPPEDFDSIFRKTQIFSEEDLGRRDDSRGQIWSHLGRRFMDLTKVAEASIQDTVFVTIDPSYAHAEQEGNCFAVERSSAVDCIRPPDQDKFLGDDPLVCFISDELKEVDIPDILRGWVMKVILSPEGPKIASVNAKTRELQIHPVRDGELRKFLSGDLEQNNKSAVFELKNREMLRRVLVEVKSNGGIARGIHVRANRIYNVAGVLFSAMEESRKSGVPISKVLLKMQFPEFPKETRNANLDEDSFYFRRGLGSLQEKIDPRLRFLVPNEIWNDPGDPNR